MPQGQSAARRAPTGQGGAQGEAPPADLVELGVLRGAYGVKGWARIAPHETQGAVLRATRRWWLKRGEAFVAVEVTGVRRHGAGLVAKWTGCEDPETAETWRGSRVMVRRADFPALPKGEFYWVDLLGAKVINRAGAELGTVTGLRNNGAQDLLEVAGPDGAEMLVPMVEAYVDGVDPERGEIRVDWEADW